MPFGLGFFATAGVSAAAGSFDLLETQVLGSSTASVTFSSLSTYASAGYQHLQIRATTRGTRSDTGSQLFIRINGDTGNNYRAHYMWGNASSVQSATLSESGIWGGWTAGANFTANGFGAMVLDLLDPFEANKNRVVRIFQGIAGYSEVSLISGMRINTEAVSSLTISERTAANLAQYSRFSLYGWKAA